MWNLKRYSLHGVESSFCFNYLFSLTYDFIKEKKKEIGQTKYCTILNPKVWLVFSNNATPKQDVAIGGVRRHTKRGGDMRCVYQIVSAK